MEEFEDLMPSSPSGPDDASYMEPMPERAPQPAMPPEAQQLTFLMAREMQAADTRILLRAGWSPADTFDTQKKTTSLIKPFGEMPEEHKKQYLDGSANAVMRLLDEGFDVKRSEDPDVAMDPAARRSAENALITAGWTRRRARRAVDAVEAAGFSIQPGPSKALRRMDAHFEMLSRGRSGADDLSACVAATVTMARNERFPREDVNAFIEKANEKFGLAVPPVTAESEAALLLRDMKEIYRDEMRDLKRESLSQRGVLSTDGRLGDPTVAASVAVSAVYNAREKVLPMVDAIADGEVRRAVVTRLDVWERDTVEEFQALETGYGRWKEPLDKAMYYQNNLQAVEGGYEENMQRWKDYRWYEKIFIPRPSSPDRKMTEELRGQRDLAAKEYAESFNEARHMEQVFVLPDGSIAKLSMQVRDGMPSLTMSVRTDDQYTTTRRIFLADGSFKELSKTETSERVEADRSQMKAITMEELRKRYEEMSLEAARAIESARDIREMTQRVKLPALTVSFEEAYRIRMQHLAPTGAMKEMRGKALDPKEKTKEQRAAERKEKEDREMPALHPHLAGDITPRDVETLMAFRLNGGKGEDFKRMIEDLKERKQIVYDGPVTWRRTESYDGPVVPVKHVFIGLRLGDGGMVTCYNPITGVSLGPVDAALGAGRSLDFNKAERIRRKQQREAQELIPTGAALGVK